jgi:hypothetical protein
MSFKVFNILLNPIAFMSLSQTSYWKLLLWDSFVRLSIPLNSLASVRSGCNIKCPVEFNFLWFLYQFLNDYMPLHHLFKKNTLNPNFLQLYSHTSLIQQSNPFSIPLTDLLSNWLIFQ